MANEEYQDIKAGVDGVLGDAPEPSGGTATAPSGEPSETRELPETSYAESSYSTNSYAQQPTGNYSSQPVDIERMHEIIEAIVEEKWEDLVSKVGNLAVWKEKVNNDVVSIKQEVIRIQENFRGLQNAILGKVKDYDEGIRGVHTEMRALEKVFEKILEPLTSNIKELTRITQELKKIKH